MDRGTASGTAEMPDVSPRLGVSAAHLLTHHVTHNLSTDTVETVQTIELVDGQATCEEAIVETVSDIVCETDLVIERIKSSNLDTDEGRDHVSVTEVRKDLVKYWKQRYRLFHRFDEGIQLDAEGWYSVTPEKVARQIANRFKGKTVVADFFSGPGGNCIQFALNGSVVIGIENSEHRIKMALNNAKVYGVRHLMEFIHGDVFEVIPMLRKNVGAIEAIFMSPPWGGPEYLDQEVYDVSRFKKAVEGARLITKNIAVLVPRNVRAEDVVRIYGECEIEQNMLGGKMKTQTIYFGDLVSDRARRNIWWL